MSRILVWLVFFMVFLLGVLFTVYNPQPITLHYVLGTLELRLALLMLFCISAGAVLGVLFTLHWVMKIRYQNRRLRKAQQQSLAEIEQLTLQLAAARGHQ